MSCLVLSCLVLFVAHYVANATFVCVPGQKKAHGVTQFHLFLLKIGTPTQNTSLKCVRCNKIKPMEAYSKVGQYLCLTFISNSSLFYLWRRALYTMPWTTTTHLYEISCVENRLSGSFRSARPASSAASTSTTTTRRTTLISRKTPTTTTAASRMFCERQTGQERPMLS